MSRSALSNVIFILEQLRHFSFFFQCTVSIHLYSKIVPESTNRPSKHFKFIANSWNSVDGPYFWQEATCIGRVISTCPFPKYLEHFLQKYDAWHESQIWNLSHTYQLCFDADVLSRSCKTVLVTDMAQHLVGILALDRPHYSLNNKRKECRPV